MPNSQYVDLFGSQARIRNIYLINIDLSYEAYKNYLRRANRGCVGCMVSDDTTVVNRVLIFMCGLDTYAEWQRKELLEFHAQRAQRQIQQAQRQIQQEQRNLQQTQAEPIAPTGYISASPLSSASSSPRSLMSDTTASTSISFRS